MALSSLQRVAVLALILRSPALAARPYYYHIESGRLFAEEITDQQFCACADGACVATKIKTSSDLAVFEDIRALNRLLVGDCAANAMNARVRVERQSPFLCRKGDGGDDAMRSNAVGYEISKAQDGVHVGVSLRFITPPSLSSERAQAMLIGMFDKCMEPIEAVWSRYGISLDPQFLWSKNGASAEIPTRYPEIRINLEDTFGRATSEKYFFRGYGSWLECFQQCIPDMSRCTKVCRGEITKDFCATMAHEIGHTLGLDDEYVDPDCPDRALLAKESYPWSIMAEHSHPWERLEFFPRHVGDVVRPLCAGTEAAVAAPLRRYLTYQPFKPSPESCGAPADGR